MSLATLATFFWHSQNRSNPTLPRPENTQITSSEKSVNQLTPTEDIVSEESSVSYNGKVFYGVITAPRDYKGLYYFLSLYCEMVCPVHFLKAREKDDTSE